MKIKCFEFRIEKFMKTNENKIKFKRTQKNCKLQQICCKRCVK